MQEHVPYNERELLAQIASGDQLAFQHLFDRYRRRVFSYALKITGSNEAAEDILQDTFLKIWSIRLKLSEIDNFNAYLHRIVHNEACKNLEIIAREELVVHYLRTEDKGDEEGVRRLHSREIRRHIQGLVDQLSPRQRAVFLLSREEGLKYSEIAERMGIGFETVKTHLAEALKFLREGLGHEYGPGAMAIIVIWQLGSI